MMKSVAVIFGTRPEFIKLYPVIESLRSIDEIQVTTISTGQHASMLEELYAFFEFQPDHDLEIMKPDQSLNEIISGAISKLDDVLNALHIDLLVVQGDTSTAFAAALSAFNRQIAIGHVEAGLRTHQKFSPYPEEINRCLISVLADFHFCPTNRSAHNLRNEGRSDIYVVGNTVVDAIYHGKARVEQDMEGYRQRFHFLNQHTRMILVTTHRREIFGEGLINICQAVAQIAASTPELAIVFPVHLNPNVNQRVYRELQDYPNIYLMDPVPYGDMIFLMSEAYLILTDSGGIQEEAAVLNIPTLVMRDYTERMEGIDAGCAKLVGTNKSHITAAFNDVFHNEGLHKEMASAENPYGDGKAARRIASILMDALN